MRANFFIAVGSVVAISAFAPRAFARKPPSEEGQRRVLLEELAAASAEIPQQEKTDADLMYEAMRQWRGEPRGSAVVDKVLEQSKVDIRHDRKALEERVRANFWKDPFSREVVPVRKEDRDLLRDHAARLARARGDAKDAEISRLQADLALVRSENARLRSELARAEENSDSNGEAEAQAGSVPPSRHLHARHYDGGRAHREGSYLEAMSAPAPVHHHRSAKARARSEAVAQAPAQVEPTPVVTSAPAGWQSSDPRGIIVVPIDAPVPIHADKSSARAH